MTMSISFVSGSVRCILGGVLALVVGGANADAWNGPGVIYSSWSRDWVSDGPPILPIFSIARPQKIIEIWDYHWNSGLGQDPALVNGVISLFDNATGGLVGNWSASARTDFYPNPTYWMAVPQAVLQPGSYTIVDSHHSTWSYSTTNYFGGGPDWGPGIGFSAVVAVPEPATVALLCLGLAALVPFSTRRHLTPDAH